MCDNGVLLDRLTEILQKIEEGNMMQKTILSFSEACIYLDISASHLYKLTSAAAIPHFCPQGKKLYFRRDELEQWLQRNYRTVKVKKPDNQS